MRLPFQRSKPPAGSPGSSGDSPPPRPSVLPTEATAIEKARTRARQRLVGASVLLLIGIVVLPMLFDTAPRTADPARTPEVLLVGDDKGKGEVPGVPALPLRPRPVLPADAGNETADAGGVAASSGAISRAPALEASAAEKGLATARGPTAIGKVQDAPLGPAPAPAALPSQHLPATAAPTPVRTTDAVAAIKIAPAASAQTGGRFVVQVGAYTDVATLRSARQRVEKLGLKTYTQDIDGDAGRRTRVRVGPFDTRAQADAAAARVRQGGLPANVLML